MLMTTETRKRILVVDDEPDMARGLQRILKTKGYEVRIANCGEVAVDQAREWQPHGMLMDLKMPGMNGVEAYRQIRTTSPNAFVVFMTAFSSMVDEAREEGAVDVLAKPLDPAKTCELIASALISRPVLIVDDDTDFRDSMSRILEEKGCAVQSAGSAAQALAMFEKQPRSVVLLDMRLGETQGLDLLRMFKERNATALVFQMSGYPESEDLMKQGLKLSSCGYFTKPLNIDAVLDAVETAMRSPV